MIPWKTRHNEVIFNFIRDVVMCNKSTQFHLEEKLIWFSMLCHKLDIIDIYHCESWSRWSYRCTLVVYYFLLLYMRHTCCLSSPAHLSRWSGTFLLSGHISAIICAKDLLAFSSCSLSQQTLLWTKNRQSNLTRTSNSELLFINWSHFHR